MNLHVISFFGRLSLAVALTAFACSAPAQDAATSVTVAPETPATTYETYRWVHGPATAKLGEYAEIFVPEGYSFVGEHDARIILRIMNNPVPRTLVGLLTPTSRNWLVIFEFNETGYIRDSRPNLDPNSILKTIRNKVERQNEEAPRIGAASIAAVSWQQAPDYNPERHSLEWSLLAESGPQKVINHVVRLLGRRGVLDGIAVQPAALGSGAIPLKEIMNGVSFKPGERYADYRKGDVVSKRGLAELIASNNTTDSDPGSSRLAWIIAGVSLGACGVVTVVLLRRRRQSAQSHGTGTISATAKHRPPAGRREFDYQRFYSDLILQVSEPSYESAIPRQTRRTAASNITRTAASPTAAPAMARAEDQSSVYKDAHLQLIAEQKSLIQEQQRLIREQSRLIEEKTRLIEEKNRILDKQIELFGNTTF
jgi:uncharacterized membrane-anchored protein